MNRIKKTFADLNNQAALVPYIVAGDPHPQQTVDIMHALVESGADVIELGMPFSDPVADGPTNQAAMIRAIDAGTTVAVVLDIVKQFRQTDQQTPIVLMGYVNPIEIMGYELFAKTASDAGVDGVLIVDCPPEEAQTFHALMQQYQIDMIFLIAPNTSTARIKMICEQASGYLYYVSLKGVTGTKAIEIEPLQAKLDEIRQFTQLPICVGFGIKTPETAKQVADIADGVVVGSALVERVASESLQTVKSFIKSLSLKCTE
tara:strand:+ start:122295 stop:123074 length:780 start_codon:yes stop_codon:yes gene_type:complete